MFGFLKQVGDYTRDAVDAARNLTQGLAVTFDHMKRRPVTVQYPYEKLIPSERYRGRIHYEFDKCIACEVCVRVCPINLPGGGLGDEQGDEEEGAAELLHRLRRLHFLRQLRGVLPHQLSVDDGGVRTGSFRSSQPQLRQRGPGASSHERDH